MLFITHSVLHNFIYSENTYFNRCILLLLYLIYHVTHSCHFVISFLLKPHVHDKLGKSPASELCLSRRPINGNSQFWRHTLVIRPLIQSNAPTLTGGQFRTLFAENSPTTTQPPPALVLLCIVCNRHYGLIYLMNPMEDCIVLPVVMLVFCT